MTMPMRGHISSRRRLGGAVVALRPTLSPAAKAKGTLLSLKRRIEAAEARGDTAEAERLKGEHAWLVMNTL